MLSLMWFELELMIFLDESWCYWHVLGTDAGSCKTYRVSWVDKQIVQSSTGSRVAHLKPCCVHLEAADCYWNLRNLMGNSIPTEIVKWSGHDLFNVSDSMRCQQSNVQSPWKSCLSRWLYLHHSESPTALPGW